MFLFDLKFISRVSKNKECLLSSNILKLVKAVGCDFSHLCDGSKQQPPFY